MKDAAVEAGFGIVHINDIAVVSLPSSKHTWLHLSFRLAVIDTRLSGVKMALPPAPAITGYETLSLLGSGQYGDVFLVRRTRDSQLFAAKVPNHARGNPLQLAQATQEAELLKRMRHVNITQCIETAEDAHSGQLAIIMEYASGGDLDEYLRSFQDRWVSGLHGGHEVI